MSVELELRPGSLRPHFDPHVSLAVAKNAIEKIHKQCDKTDSIEDLGWQMFTDYFFEFGNRKLRTRVVFCAESCTVEKFTVCKTTQKKDDYAVDFEMKPSTCDFTHVRLSVAEEAVVESSDLPLAVEKLDRVSHSLRRSFRFRDYARVDITLRWSGENAEQAEQKLKSSLTSETSNDCDVLVEIESLKPENLCKNELSPLMRDLTVKVINCAFNCRISRFIPLHPANVRIELASAQRAEN